MSDKKVITLESWENDNFVFLNKYYVVQKKSIVNIFSIAPKWDITILVSKWGKLYLNIINYWEDLNLKILEDHEWWEVYLNIVNLIANWKTKTSVNAEIAADNCKCIIKILNLVWKAEVFAKANIIIGKNTKNWRWELDQNNIYFDDEGKITWIPELTIKTNDVIARHGLKAEKISDEKLFFFTSRWISIKSAKRIFIQNMIWEIFKWSEFNYEEHLDKILKEFN